jgi:RNA polymerase sigma factor (sigma-70 family)
VTEWQSRDALAHADTADTIEDLFRSERHRLARYFGQKIGNSEDVTDLVQETFARMAGVQPGMILRNPRAYLQRIARNLLFNRSRRQAADFVGQQVPLEGEWEISVPPEQGQALEAQQLLDRYRAAVDSLTARTREVFLLHRANELDYRTIADRLDISISTVEYHIARALVHISRELDRP